MIRPARRRTARRRTARTAAAAALACAALAPALAAPSAAHDGEHHPPRPPAVKPTKGMVLGLVQLHLALRPYRDADRAIADGYVPSACAESPDGGMGVHFVNHALLGEPVDPRKPAVLLYEPQADGGYRLMGAEFFTVDADQDLGTDEDRPSLWGVPFDGPMEGHEPGMPVHYDLHVWLYEHNPDGLFAPWNPRVHCP